MRRCMRRCQHCSHCIDTCHGTHHTRFRANTRFAFTLGSCLLVFMACDGPDSDTSQAEEGADAVPGVTGEAEPTTSRAQEAATTVPAGTSMTFTVDETISTEENEVGDEFTATLAAPVTGPAGNTLIDAGMPSRWTVQAASTEGDSTVLAARVESIQLDGGWTPIPAEVVSADIRADTAATGGETAAKIGVGAAAGALIGQILGEDTQSTLAGAGVGAAVGTVVALATRGGSATLPAGSTLTVELTEPLNVSP